MNDRAAKSILNFGHQASSALALSPGYKSPKIQNLGPSHSPESAKEDGAVSYFFFDFDQVICYREKFPYCDSDGNQLGKLSYKLLFFTKMRLNMFFCSADGLVLKVLRGTLAQSCIAYVGSIVRYNIIRTYF